MPKPELTCADLAPPVALAISIAPASSAQDEDRIEILAPASKLPGLSPAELKLLRRKQTSLSLNASSTLQSLPAGTHFRDALNATLIFAQHEAGTAVCIDSRGWILTCAHCFGDTEEEKDLNKRRWLLFYTGLAVQVECRAWDARIDLALLKVISVESKSGTEPAVPRFSCAPISLPNPRPRAPIFCIGQPGKDDLESTTNRRTKYNLVEVSEGCLQGMVQGADPHDNSEIGTLKHNAWTYWGHSGAPLLLKGDGKLVGLHSSWDDQTGMRHGVPLVAIRRFVQQQIVLGICPPLGNFASAEQTDGDIMVIDLTKD